MTAFAVAWDAWIAYHRSNGFAVERFLYPPAAEADLAALERDIGFALPPELRELWARADGQIEPMRIADPAPGTIVSPFFGGYDWIGVATAADEYRSWREIALEDDGLLSEAVTVRGADPVHADYWRPGWLCFARDGGGNAYAVDLSPAEGGTYGQVILFGPDEDERRVLAPGIAAFMAEAAARRPPLDREDAAPPLFFFEMEPGGVTSGS